MKFFFVSDQSFISAGELVIQFNYCTVYAFLLHWN